MTTVPVRTEYLYPLSASSGYHLEVDGVEFECSATGFRAYRRALGGRASEWGLATNFKNISGGDRVWVYFTGPDKFIGAVGTVRDAPHPVSEWGTKAIWIEWDDELSNALATSPIRYETFKQWVPGAATTPTKRTASVLKKWLATIESSTHRQATGEVQRVRREVEQRLGQKGFRDALRSAYGDQCAVTGTRLTTLLEAAHIVPVALGGKHLASNGLLLRADIHTLFDLGYITVDDDRRIRVHPAATDYMQYDAELLLEPARRADRPTLSALRNHRRRARLLRAS